MKRFLSGLALLTLIGVLGCGGSSKVEGTVTWSDGTPVSGATVVFMPEGGKGESANGATDATGKFSLMTNGKPGARPGQYAVLITKTATTSGSTPADMIKMKDAPKSKSEVDAKYGQPDKTPFKVKVPGDDYSFKLDKATKK